MITLTKTAEPLHTMTDAQVDNAIRAWERASDRPGVTPAMKEFRECMIDVFDGERLRRLENIIRSWH